MNENKQTNAAEFAKLFHVSTGCMAGTAGEKEVASLARLAAVPLMSTIECALNRDLLLEKEKGHYYFAFDTKELLRGDMQSRFAAYKTALDANFMQIDEVRYAEDMEPLGLEWIRLGLQDVLYDPKTHELFTPNTGTRQILGDSGPEALPQGPEDGILEQRGRYYKCDEKGRFAGGGGGGSIRRKKGGTKYAPSPQRNHNGVQLKPKEYAKLCGAFNTRYPGLKPEDGARPITNATYLYRASADGYGGLTVHSKQPIKDRG